MKTTDNSARCIPKPFVRNSWCRERLKAKIDPVSMTQESHRDQTDVNAIIARFERTGHMPQNREQPQYGDVSHLNDDLLVIINRAKDIIDTAETFASTWKEPETPAAPTTTTEASQPPPA